MPMNPSSLSRDKGARLIWLLSVAAVAGVVVARLLSGGAESSGIVWVPGFEELFVDWRTYLAAADCTRLGLDPYNASSTCLYWSDSPYGGIPSNLPSYFHDGLRVIGATESWGTASGWVFIAAFFCAVALMPTSRHPAGLALQALALFLVCMSPAGMLGFAKGNMEIVFVALGITAVLLASRVGPVVAIAPWLVAVPAVLKYVPGVALAVFLFIRNRWLLISTIAALAFTIGLFLATSNSLARRLGLTPQADVNSFGSRLDAGLLLGAPSTWIQAVTLVLTTIGTGAVIGAFLAWRWSLFSNLTTDRLLLAATGALVVVAAWAVFTNWEYRWLWVVLVIPLLAFDKTPPSTRISGGAVLILISAAPWVTRTDVARGWATSLLTVASIWALSAIVAATLVTLARQQRPDSAKETR